MPKEIQGGNPSRTEQQWVCRSIKISTDIWSRRFFPLKTIGGEGWKPLFMHVFLSFTHFIGQKKNTFQKPKFPFIGAEEMD